MGGTLATGTGQSGAGGGARPPGPAPGRDGPTTKAAEVLARRIEAEIIDRGWPVGQLLGTESDLLQRFGVGRPVLREAVRLLEHHMVAEMRRGAGGGLRVTAPDPWAVTNAAALYLDYRGARVGQLYTARTVLEARCVELATERLTEDGVARLRTVVDQLRCDDVDRLVELDHEVERVIAELGGDPVLTLFVDVLLRLADQHNLPAAERPARRRGIHAMRDHQVAIAEAVIAGDAATARVRLVRYLEWAAANARRRFLGSAGAR